MPFHGWDPGLRKEKASWTPAFASSCYSAAEALWLTTSHFAAMPTTPSDGETAQTLPPLSCFCQVFYKRGEKSNYYTKALWLHRLGLSKLSAKGRGNFEFIFTFFMTCICFASQTSFFQMYYTLLKYQGVKITNLIFKQKLALIWAIVHLHRWQ